VNFFA